MKQYEKITQINKEYFINHNNTSFMFNLKRCYNYDILDPEEIKLAVKHTEIRIEDLKRIHEVINIYKNMDIPFKFVKKTHYPDSRYTGIHLSYNSNELTIEYQIFKTQKKSSEPEQSFLQRLFKTKIDTPKCIKEPSELDEFETNYNILLNKYIGLKNYLENEIKWLEEKINDENIEYSNPPLFSEKSMYKIIDNCKVINLPSYTKFDDDTPIEDYEEAIKNNEIIHDYLKECKKVNTKIKWSIGENQRIEIYKNYIHIILNKHIMYSLTTHHSKPSNSASFISFPIYNGHIIKKNKDKKLGEGEYAPDFRNRMW